MSKPTIDDVQLIITKMITAEYADHSALLKQIDSRNPASKDKIVESLSVVHNTRVELLENILSVIKSMKTRK